MTLAAGCGDRTEPEPQPGGGDSGVGEPATALTVVLDPDGPGGAPAMRERVECAAGAATLGCERASDLSPEAIEPVPPGVPCTQVYGGPDVAELSGRLDGRPVEAKLTRANGCEIGRFEAALPLLRSLFGDYVPGGALQPPSG